VQRGNTRQLLKLMPPPVLFTAIKAL